MAFPPQGFQGPLNRGRGILVNGQWIPEEEPGLPAPPPPDIFSTLPWLQPYLDQLLQQQATRAPVITNPLAAAATPGAAFTAGVTSLLDAPGDYGAAARAAFQAAGRAPYAASVSELPSLSGAAQQRGVELGPVPGLAIDLLGDLTNLIGGDPVSDLSKVGLGMAVLGTKSLKGLVGVTEAAKAARTLFPRLDKYGKASGRLTGARLLERLGTATDISDQARATLTQLAEQIGERRISPDELHALAAGQVYKPERVIRKVKLPVEGGAKQIVGAPLGITTARQEKALRDRFLKLIERGLVGRDWYKRSGQSILFHANDIPERAMQFAGDISATSSSTSVGANAGMGIKGYNLATASTPAAPLAIEAGRFPTAMGARIAEIHDPSGVGLQGLKQQPFTHNMARAGGFLGEDVPRRAVNDIWQGEALGYVNPDGTPMRAGFGPAQHRWMDQQMALIIEEANRRGIGGFTDWDVDNAQAAGWVGAKVEAGQMSPADAAKAYSDYFPEHYAQGGRETIPGRSTQHLPELHQPGMESLRQLYHDIINAESGIYDTQLRDQIAAGYGGLTGQSFEGPGVYRGAPAPGRQTQVLTGSVEVPGGRGARALDAGSRRILDASESTYGLLTAQDASAYTRVLPAGAGQPRNAWDVILPGGKVTNSEMQKVLTKLGAAGDDMVLIPTPDGIRLAFMDEPTMKILVKELGGKVKTSGTLQSNLISNNWQTHRVGQTYFDAIEKIGTEKFDAFAPEMAQHMRDIDRRFAKETNGRFTLSPVIDEVRAAIANEGWAGLQKLAKKYAIPVVLLATGLAELQTKFQPSRQEG